MVLFLPQPSLPQSRHVQALRDSYSSLGQGAEGVQLRAQGHLSIISREGENFGAQVFQVNFLDLLPAYPLPHDEADGPTQCQVCCDTDRIRLSLRRVWVLGTWPENFFFLLGREPGTTWRVAKVRAEASRCVTSRLGHPKLLGHVEQPLTSPPDFVLGPMAKEMIPGIASGPACPPVVLGGNCTLSARFSRWAEEGSPEINLFSSQVSDWEGVLFSCLFKHLSILYDIEP